MANAFDTREMAEGYARWRPPVHPLVMELIHDYVGRAYVGRKRRALDVGYGAGMSTAPLRMIAEVCIGIDPSVAMVSNGRMVAPHAWFAAGRAEYTPIRSGSIDVITAAGSLNWVDLDAFLAEARRMLSPGGVLVVYDFAQGDLRGWDAEFKSKYPSPPCRSITLDTLPPVARYETFDIGLMLEPEFYLEYAMTETNVAAAIERGVAREEIRQWCESALEPVFEGRAQEVRFEGYVAYIQFV